MRNWAVVFLMAFATWGCQSIPAPKPNPIPPVGTSIERADSHTQSAEASNQRIKPHADKTGQELVGVVSDEHKAARLALTEAKMELAKTQAMVDQLDQDILDVKADEAKKVAKAGADRDYYKNSLGYRAEVIVRSILTALIIIASLHVLLGVVAMFLPMFFPASIVAVPLLKKLAAFFNPIAWFQYGVDHFHPCNCPPPLTLQVKTV